MWSVSPADNNWRLRMKQLSCVALLITAFILVGRLRLLHLDGSAHSMRLFSEQLAVVVVDAL